MSFPDSTRRCPMLKFPGGEVVTVARHVRTRRVDVVMRADAFAPRALAPMVATFSPAFALVLRTPVRRGLDKLINRLPEGPSEDRRRAASFTFVAEALGRDGRYARGEVQGTDIYGITAVITVEGVRRLVTDGAPAGVLAPAEAFDPADFLDFLGAHGLRWNVEAQEPAPAQAPA